MKNRSILSKKFLHSLSLFQKNINSQIQRFKYNLSLISAKKLYLKTQRTLSLLLILSLLSPFVTLLAPNPVYALVPAGSIDVTFDVGSGANGEVKTVAVQSDGKVIIAGDFTSYNGTPRNRIARLNSDGSLDSSFNVGSGANGVVNAVAIQSDGKVLIGGNFTSYNGQGRNRIVRLDTDGSLDDSFNVGTGANGVVNAIALQSDGKVLTGGDFTSYNDTNRNRIIRLNTDGSLDNTFDVGSGVNGEVNTIAVESNGYVLIGGDFTTYNGIERNRVARLTSTESPEVLSLWGQKGTDGTVNALKVQSDGGILLGGGFNIYEEEGRSRVARSYPNFVSQDLPGGSNITNSVSTIHDINGDGYNEILVGDFMSVPDKILLSNGSGDWTAQNLPYVANTSTNSISTIGDINGDGCDEIIVGSGLRNQIILSDGSGGWTAQYLPGGSRTTRSISTISDINGDDYDEIIVGNENQINQILLNNGSGGWTTQYLPGGSRTTRSISTISDINGDGYEEIIVGNKDQINQILLSDGSGGWTAQDLPGGDRDTRSISTISDINGDGYEEIIVGNASPHTNQIILSDGSGGWTAQDLPWLSSLNTFSISTISDINGDGYEEIIVGNYMASNNILLSNGSGGWTAQNLPGGSMQTFSMSTKSDINGDGYEDIIVGNFGGEINQVLLSRIIDNSFNVGTGTNNSVYAFDTQSDDRVLMGGDFTSYDGNTRNRLIRLNTNGSIDTSFNIGSGANDKVNSIAVTGNKAIVGGAFTTYDGDTVNGVMRILLDDHHQVDSLTSSLDVTDVNGMSLRSESDYGQRGNIPVYLRNTSGIILSSVDTNFTADLNWNGVSGEVDISTGKSVVTGLTSAPGTASTHTLYIPIPSGTYSTTVQICPDATDLSEVTVGCTNGEIFSNNQTKSVGGDTVTVTKEYIDGDWYWLADGVSGTGGISIASEFILRDTLSRLEVNADSNHTIEFGSINGLETSGDTIEIVFDPSNQAWDLSSITVGDIEMDAEGMPLTLGATPGVDTWGVDINDTTDTITFTAPTSGTGYIAPNSAIEVRIGDHTAGGSNQITNPSTVAEYEVSMTNTYSAGGGGTETGEVEIPIVDDDTVNITGYIDTVMSFDIDTAVSDVQCDAAGGASACNSHGGASDGAGYVVDLGEMTLSSVNKSGDSVTHADGLTGNINYIWFDLETNASSGAVVTVVSQYEALYKDSTNEIPSVATGSEQQILAASGLYGLNHRSGFTNSTAIGSMLVDVDCDASSGDDYYCDVADGGTPISIFDSNSLPVDDGRMQFSVGAAPDSADGTGTYTDQLTFVASATF